MDWFPLYNSIRIAVIATALTFVLGVFFAYYVAKMPRVIKGILYPYTASCYAADGNRIFSA